MDKNSPYYKQVALLVNCLPYVAGESCFALKGGTAINLFVQNFPRLSVDIDLVYLPLEPRSDALINIRTALERVTKKINDIANLSAVFQNSKSDELRVIVSTAGRIQDSAQIKIEVSPVARGTLHEVTHRDINEQVEEEFGFASIQTVSLPDLYGGKLCAAMDRQHPRDLFDVKILLESTGINRELFVGFLAYLLMHNRPMAEVLSPRWKDISDTFNKEFHGMTFESIDLSDLQAVPDAIEKSLKKHFTQTDIDFLLSFKSGEPDWSLSPHSQLKRLPAVQWKLFNIQKMSVEKRKSALVNLSESMLVWLES